MGAFPEPARLAFGFAGDGRVREVDVAEEVQLKSVSALRNRMEMLLTGSGFLVRVGLTFVKTLLRISLK